MRDLRIEARLTTFQLASKSGVSISSINRIESGRHAMKRLIVAKVLYALSQELGRTVTLEDIQGLQIVD